MVLVFLKIIPSNLLVYNFYKNKLDYKYLEKEILFAERNIMKLHMGLDVGSTTVKTVITNGLFETIYEVYTRHKSDVKETVKKVLTDAYDRFKDDSLTVNVTGSGGMFLEKLLGINFVQEVIAEKYNSSGLVQKYVTYS